MVKHWSQIITTLFITLYIPIASTGQDDFTEYGKLIYTMIIQNDRGLLNEFVDLREYTAYIDQLDKLPAKEKESIKRDASRSYKDVLRDYEDECLRILSLYANSKEEGISFSYSTTEFNPSRNFPNIGIITFYYIVEIPGFEEPEEDGIRFECIRTKNGWRILDGFFDLTD